MKVLLLLVIVLCSSCTVNKTVIQKVEGDVYVTPHKDLVPQSRADKIRAMYYQVDTTKVYKDDAAKRHESIKRYMTAKNKYQF